MNLLEAVSSFDCHNTLTSSSTVTATSSQSDSFVTFTTRKPFKTSTTSRTTVAYVLEDEPVSKPIELERQTPILVNDTGASLQLSAGSNSGVHSDEPSTTLSSNYGSHSSAANLKDNEVITRLLFTWFLIAVLYIF